MSTFTEKQWDELVAGEVMAAKQQRMRVSGDEDFVMSVKVVGPGGQFVKTPLTWRSNNEKTRAMYVLSRVCEQIFAQAAVVTSDARTLNVPAFCKHFGIAEPKQIGDYKAFNEARARVMEPFGQYLGNLPSELYTDALLVFVYGPQVKRFATTNYFVRPNGIEFEETVVGASDAVTINMMRPWWQ